MTVAGGASTLLSNVVGTTSIVSGYSANTLQSVTGTATSNVVQDATVYSFTSGTGGFTVPTGGVIVDYLVVGGGGGGGSGMSGGGGAGGLVYTKGVQLPAGTYTWTVGAGGAAGAAAGNNPGTTGSNSSLSNSTFGNVVALGGGGGGNNTGGATTYPGLAGGSAGGAAYSGPAGLVTSATSGAVGQGNAGGSMPSVGWYTAAGGGGAGVAGGTPTQFVAGAGGNGLAISITGSNVYYAGGGAGGNYYQNLTSSGGLGGGGNGGGSAGTGAYTLPTSALANTGGGGGAGAYAGAAQAAGTAGGSGIVIIRVYTNIGSRMLIGDGSGYSLALSAQSNAVTTDVMTIGDQGNVSIGLSNAVFYYLYGIARDGSNNLYATDNRRIRKINAATGIVTTLAGTGHPTQATIVTGNGTGVNLLGGYAIAYNTSLNVLYFANGASIAVMDSNGNITTFVGSATTGSTDGTGATASFSDIRDMVLDNTNTYLYVSDLFNNKIRRITVATSNVATMVLGGTGNQVLLQPDGICFDSNSNCLYLANYGKGVVCKIPLTGGSLTQTPTVLAGSGGPDTYSVDGTGTAASFCRPLGVCVDLTGSNVYVLDGGYGYGSKIRKIVVSSTAVTTIAGGNTVGSLDANGTSALLGYACRTVLIDSFGSNLYFTDNGNNKIRKLNLATCNVTTFAGTGVAGFADGSVPTTTFVNNTLLVNSNVGINCNAPAYTLDVAGSTQLAGNVIVSSSTGQALYIGSNTASGSTGMLRLTNAFGSNYIQSALNLTTGSAAPLLFTTMNASVEWARFDSNGKLGIGTNAPTGLLSTYLTGGIWPGSWTAGATNTWADPLGGAGQWAVFGPGSSNPTGANAGAVGISYNLSSNVGWIQCVAPAIAWRPLQIGASYINFIGGGATAGGAAVGIGYPVGTAPQTALDVKGVIQVTYANYGCIQLRNSNENSILYSDSNVAGANTGWLVGQSTNSIPSGSGFAVARIVTGSVSSTVGQFMLSNGYTGINCNAPAYTLDVAGTIRATGGYVYSVQTF